MTPALGSSNLPYRSTMASKQLMPRSNFFPLTNDPEDGFLKLRSLYKYNGYLINFKLFNVILKQDAQIFCQIKSRLVFSNLMGPRYRRPMGCNTNKLKLEILKYAR